MATPKQITCTQCGKRRKPATGSKGRPLKRCNECVSGTFWQSAFGQWFLSAALRQSSDSMPHDNDDIVAIYAIWKRARSWKGVGYTAPRRSFDNLWEDIEPDGPAMDVEGRWTVQYEYDISHLDPVTGDGYQGRLTASNLVVAPSRINKSMGNTDNNDFGHRVYSDKAPFKSKEEVMNWCNGKYDTGRLSADLKLKPKRQDTNLKDYTLEGKHPNLAFKEELERLSEGRHTYQVSSHQQAYKALLRSGIEAGAEYSKAFGYEVSQQEEADEEF